MNRFGWCIAMGLQDKILKQIASKLNIDEIKATLSGLDDKLVEEFFNRVDVEKLASDLKDQLADNISDKIIKILLEKLSS